MCNSRLDPEYKKQNKQTSQQQQQQKTLKNQKAIKDIWTLLGQLKK